jgi:cation diffusion facilitator CzcD-associated flavoprotein CzcO
MKATEVYDTVVIGAGFAGLVAARDLLEAGNVPLENPGKLHVPMG